MLDKINGKKSTVRIIDHLSFIPKDQIDRLWESIRPKINIEIQIEFPIILGEPWYQPEFFDPGIRESKPRITAFAASSAAIF